MKREPRAIGIFAEAGAILVAATLTVAPVAAQQITGTPGSPSATITLDGKQLPPAPPKFGGVIKESALESKPWWPPRVVPPKGAPAFRAMLIYNALIALYLAYLDTVAHLGGLLLWPTVALHAVVASLPDWTWHTERRSKATNT